MIRYFEFNRNQKNDKKKIYIKKMEKIVLAFNKTFQSLKQFKLYFLEFDFSAKNNNTIIV